MTLTDIVTFSKLSYFLTKLRTELGATYVSIDSMFYKDFYLGVGATESDVKIAANYHAAERKSSVFSFTASSQKVWLIIPSTYSPVLEMSSIDIPMVLDRTYTSGNVTYKVWKSDSSYTGTFNLCIL
jgi:hypothetical protein